MPGGLPKQHHVCKRRLVLSRRFEVEPVTGSGAVPPMQRDLPGHRWIAAGELRREFGEAELLVDRLRLPRAVGRTEVGAVAPPATVDDVQEVARSCRSRRWIDWFARLFASEVLSAERQTCRGRRGVINSP